MCVFLRWPIAEILLGLVIAVGHWLWWRQKSVTGLECRIEERQLGANVIIGQLTGLILATTVTFGLLGAFTALISDTGSWSVRANAWSAAVMAFSSLAVALWVLAMIPSYVERYNVARIPEIATGAVLALYCFLMAIWRFGAALWSVL